jgi:transcription elongation factor GreA
MQTPKRKVEKFTYIAVDTHMTQEKFYDLKKNLDRMLKSRPKLAKDVKMYAANGDFSENAEYQIAKGKLRGLNRRITETTDLINKANIIKPSKNSDIVELGSTVTVLSNKKEKTYQILGSSETNPDKGIISHNSPIGKSLIGKKVGEEVSIEINKKEVDFKILKIV